MAQIFVKIGPRKMVDLQFEHMDTIRALKEKLLALSPDLCRPGQCLELMFAGEPMEDGRTLADYNVMEASMVHAFVFDAPTAGATARAPPRQSEQPADRAVSNPAPKAKAIARAPSRRFEQPVDTGKCFVFCATGQHGEDPRARVCRCSFKLRCTSCGAETIELPEGKGMQDLCPTTASLRRCMNSRARIPGTVCHNYDAEEHDGGPGLAGVDCGSIFVACEEPQLDGRACHASSYLSQCCVLPQVVAAGPGETCCVLGEAPDDGKLIRFDPCGHTISLEYFIEHATLEIKSGCASRKLVQSHVTGHHAFPCPMGGELCARSLVHDLHHYRMLGDDESGVSYYARLKELAVEQYYPVPKPKATTPSCSPVVAQMHEAIIRAQIFQCPRCDAQGVKDGGCMFPTCPVCGGEFCYWCGRPSESHECPSNCRPIFLSEAKLSNGFEFSDNGHAALQEYHVWRLKWYLKRLYDKVGRREFEKAVASEPHVLEELFADDGTGDLGVDGALAGVTIKVEDIIKYERVSVVGKFFPDDYCDPFPDNPKDHPRGCVVS